MSSVYTNGPKRSVSLTLGTSFQIDQLREHYRTALFDDVIPWWQQHSVDRQHGGYLTRLERDGHAYSGDKDMWMIGRQIWMFAHLFNRQEQNPQWRDIALHGAAFTQQYAMRNEGKVYFRLTRDGRPLATCLSLYTECFVAIAMAELGTAADNPDYWDTAVALYDRLMPRLGVPSDTPMLGYPLQAEFHLHAHDMMQLTVASVFDGLLPNRRWQADIHRSVESIVSRHWKPELGALLENVAPDGTPMLDLPEGRMFHPGHSIESAWMLMEVAQANDDYKLLDTAIEIALAALAAGWDERYGGVRYLTNLDATPVHSLEADLKLWWPHCESLYATLLGWMLTGREDLRRWYEKLHDYTFSAFADLEYGEWFGYLNRDGSRVFTAKANGWKGCFHLPRTLFRCYRLLSDAERRPSAGKV